MIIRWLHSFPMFILLLALVWSPPTPARKISLLFYLINVLLSSPTVTSVTGLGQWLVWWMQAAAGNMEPGRMYCKKNNNYELKEAEKLHRAAENSLLLTETLVLYTESLVKGKDTNLNNSCPQNKNMATSFHTCNHHNQLPVPVVHSPDKSTENRWIETQLQRAFLLHWNHYITDGDFSPTVRLTYSFRPAQHWALSRCLAQRHSPLLRSWSWSDWFCTRRTAWVGTTELRLVCRQRCVRVVKG